MLVRSDGGSQDELFLAWQKFDTLDHKAQDILTANELPLKLKILQDKFNLSRDITAKVSLLVREIIFQEIDLPGAEAKIVSLLTQTPGGDPNRAKDIVSFIDREILHLIPKPVNEEVESVEQPKVIGVIKKPLLKALSEYPRLGEQNITANRIKTKQSSEPVRGSLTNWIHYYRDELGIGFHDQVLRGKFLFQSENGKRLSGEERERLNLILKSIEEEFPLDIDTARQEIVFPDVTIPQSNQGGGAPLRGAVSFPTPQASSSASKPEAQAFSAPIFQGGMNQPSGVSSRGVNPWVIQPPTSLASRPPIAAQSKASFGGASRPVSTSSASAVPSLVGNMKPIENIANHTVQFSTGHVLPAEKASQETQVVPPVASVPVAASTGATRFGTGQRITNPANQSRSPYSIRPFRSRSDKP